MSSPMIQRHANTRHAIVDAVRKLGHHDLNRGSSGNVSVRLEDGTFLMTPSGVDADRLRPQDIVVMTVEGQQVTGRLQPSTEWHFHAALYRQRPEFSSIIHTHAPYCTTLAVLERGIPPFHYMVAKAGGRDIRCAPYATFGTKELSDVAVQAMEGRKACLLAHHGMIAAERSLEKALKLTIEVEDLARVYWQALQIQEPRLMDDAEMDRVLEKFKTYGTPQAVTAPSLFASPEESC